MVSLPATQDPAQCIGGIENGHALIGAQPQQIAVAGGDQIGLCGERSRNHRIIVGIVRHGAFDRLGKRGRIYLFGVTEVRRFSASVAVTMRMPR